MADGVLVSPIVGEPNIVTLVSKDVREREFFRVVEEPGPGAIEESVLEHAYI